MNLQERMRERERQIDRCKNSKNLPKENVYWFNVNDWTWLISQIELLSMTLVDNNRSDFHRNSSLFFSHSYMHIAEHTKEKMTRDGRKAISLFNNEIMTKSIQVSLDV